MTKRLADILVEAGVITTPQLEECITITKESKQPITRCLVDKEFSTYEAIAKTLATHSNLDFLEAISEENADLATLGKVPLHFLKNHVVIPLILLIFSH